MASRMSMYSMASEALGGGPQAAQVSTTTLLNAIHNIYLSSQPYQLDASTSLVVNTWLTAAQAGATVDATLAARAWEHARRRAEDGCVILGSLHQSTPSLLVPFLNTFPFAIPASIYKSLEALQTIALGVTLTLSLGGNVTGASLALSQGGIDTENGLLNIPAEAGYPSTPAEREFLGLKSPSAYALLARSGTYEPPSYLITADDGAAADDFRQALKEIGIKGSAHRNFISTLAGLLKLDDFEEICEDVSGLLGMEPEVLMQQLSTEDRRTLVGGLYEALVDWMLRIRDGDESIDGRGVRTPTSNEDVPEPSIGRALAMRTIFDDTIGINAEMIEDGVEVHPVGSSVVREMQQAVSDGRDRQHDLEKREVILEKVAYGSEDDSFVKKLLFPVEGEGVSLGRAGRFDLPALLSASRTWFHLSFILRMTLLPTWLLSLPSLRHGQLAQSPASFAHGDFPSGLTAATATLITQPTSTSTNSMARTASRPGCWREAGAMAKSSSARSESGAWAKILSLLALTQVIQPTLPMAARPQLPPQLCATSRPQVTTVSVPRVTHTRVKSITTRTVSSREFWMANLPRTRRSSLSPLPFGRRAWIAFVWALTFWIPSPLLKFIGRMRRPDVRMAWREKFVLFFLIILINGMLLCPNANKAWNVKEVATHAEDEKSFWVAIHGKHSDTSIKVTKQNMLPLSGMVMDNYFMPPLNRACRGLGIKETTQLTFNDTITNPLAQHTSGFYTRDRTSALHDPTVYDLTDYLHTLDVNDNFDSYKFLNEDMKDLDLLIANAKNETVSANLKNSWQCIQNIAYKGILDFRDSARCQVNNYLLLAFAIIICIVTAVKFLAALQFGSKRRPSPQDKFVICQVPVYTEGEDSLRKALDSLTALQYDNKRKLICVICDGVVVGQGNDRPTPKIVLDILGVDPKVDPPALPFKSVGSSSEQLNYGKVYSGLYEFEGNVVPYIVVVKVGKESEQSKAKPGNRGKRDSQILLMSFLNRVHHRAPMSPLELEMFHQVNNIIGVDPELYEYLLMVDADTCVEEDSLNRLVAACAHNAKIAGICGETALENDEKTWWTMIQVYEYFISHHLAKAFESLFGSVTCLPGCFTMYRLRSVDKGKPLIISDAVIKDYSVCDVDTLHKKNLLSLGEDRYLTTLMTKYFPEMSYKFIPDAQCKTAAPESWSVLLSQRRRWINSTIHNLVELMQLKELCGFCCFSMRFVVFIDLCGTIILPSTCVYIGYLIYILATGSGPIPYISLAMIGAVYGLQALIFILKRQWQHIGWMIIYILAFPIYSFILPLYSFWNQDNFSWGNTRIVIGEKGNKQVVAVDDEGFDPRSIPLQRWDDYALANNLPGRRGGYQEKTDYSYGDNYELDEIKSVYSAGPQGSVLTGMPGRNTYMPPQSPAFNNGRASTMGFQDSPMQHRQSMMSMGTGVHDMRSQSPYQDYPGQHPSVSNLRGQANLSPATGGGHSRSGTALGFSSGARSPMPDAMRSQSSFDFQHGHAGPNDMAIVESIRSVLCEVDLDTVTKKQVRALVEQRLQTELVGERRTFMDRQIDHELENM
ncbi:chitin synthase-domain-containing protein [Fusarium oxysporum]|nr:chitin synthase-domain-containing protein [Fusarium oxysporum]